MEPRLIIGPAGTGKTHELMESIIAWLGSNGPSHYQSVLALTRMHGSRRRLKNRIREKNLLGNFVISTVDSFALSILNRWRKCFGLEAPVFFGVPGGFRKDIVGCKATFDEIMCRATTLLESVVVGRTISNSHPFIVLDEFQDCTGPQLGFIKALSRHCHLVMAADPFQELNGDESAVNWALEMEAQNSASVTRLTQQRRTTSFSILRSAEAIRGNSPLRDEGIPFYYAPRYRLAVWKTLPTYGQNGTYALLFPAKAIFAKLKNAITQTNDSRAAQGKKSLWFPYREMTSEEVTAENITQSLTENLSSCSCVTDPQIREVYSQLKRTASCRCLEPSSEILIEHVVSTYIHGMKFCHDLEARFSAMTIHSAKNREFDHVVILWDINHVSNLSVERQRRLLYNAITRAKRTCSLVALGPRSPVLNSPLLKLLDTTRLT